MQKQEAKKRLEELQATLKQYAEAYYKNEGIVSDSMYDALYQEVQSIEARFPELQTKQSVTQTVGASLSDKFDHKTHSTAMYSLSNQYSVADLQEWYKRLSDTLQQDKLAFVCELKIDGVALSLVYEQGKLIEALTRGNGTSGDVITQNVYNIVQDIPLTIASKTRTVVRGEVYLTKTQFALLNQERSQQGQEEFKNPRNTVSGSLQLKSVDVIRKRGLRFFAYDIVEGDLSNQHWDNLALLKSYQFNVNKEGKKCETLEEVIAFYESWTEENRKKLDFEIDGLVIKLNNIELRTAVGYTVKFPRWATAWKFKTEQARSRLLYVKNTVGRTGVITPLAYIEAVMLGGTKVQRASLYNYDQVKQLGVFEEDLLIIEKGGEIIPKIVAVLPDERKPDALSLTPPTHCPVCEQELEQEETLLRCVNILCPAIRKEKIVFFASKNAMDIQDLGGQTVSFLFDERLLLDIDDIYSLKNKKEELAQLKGFGEKSIERLLAGIEKTREPELGNFIFALGIRHIGKVSANLLAKNYKTLAAFQQAKADELAQINGLGEMMCDSVIQWLESPLNQALLNRLEEKGVRPKDAKEETKGHFSTQKIVLTGKLGESRIIWKNRLETLGFQVMSAISKQVDYVLVGEGAGSKQKKAQQWGVIIIDEAIAQELGKTIFTKEDIMQYLQNNESHV